jgi:hypothetical protein
VIHYNKVIQGAVNYADAELIAPFNGSAKAWGIGIALGLAAKRADQVFAAIKNNAFLTSLGLVEGEMIDIDAVYAEALKMARKGSATVNIPMIGAVTFKESDVESLYRYIKEV